MRNIRRCFRRFCRPVTDAEGRFKIKAIEGQTYRLAATLVQEEV